MSTTKQLAANRRNAQNSTGPRTLEGKARSARNGLKHGLTAEQQVIPSESEADFDDFVAAMRLEHDPQTPTEHLLVDQIISASWRLQRVRLLETNFYKIRVTDLEEHYENDEEHLASLAFHKDTGPRSTLTSLARHESRLERAFFRALKELRLLQSRRPPEPVEDILQSEPNFEPSPAESPVSDPPPAIMHPLQPPPPDPQSETPAM